MLIGWLMLVKCTLIYSVLECVRRLSMIDSIKQIPWVYTSMKDWFPALHKSTNRSRSHKSLKNYQRRPLCHPQSHRWFIYQVSTVKCGALLLQAKKSLIMQHIFLESDGICRIVMELYAVKLWELAKISRLCKHCRNLQKPGLMNINNAPGLWVLIPIVSVCSYNGEPQLHSW